MRWETLDAIPPLETAAPVVTGEGVSAPAPESEAPAKSALTADKPYVVYVTDPGADAKAIDAIEKVIFDDDRIQLGTKAFHMVRMAPEAATADPILKEKGGKEVPRLILVTADLKSVKAIEGNALKVSEVWSGMKAVAGRHYKQDLDSVVKDLLSVLGEFDKIAKARAVVDEKEKRLADRMTPADQKDLEAKRAELDAKQKKAEAERDKLLELKAKDAKSA